MFLMVHVQSVLGQRYELHEVLGRGAMGVVYRASDRVLARDVAVKVLALDRAEDPTFVARFEREALAVAALNDPRIVAVYDSGYDDGTRFIVMEYVRGESLAQLLRGRGPLPVARAVEIAAQIAGALAVAHRAGIIHRDVKPANVMVDEGDSVKVLDFGIAKAAANVSLTQTATVLGSAPYLAPEVIRGERADERSDVYSLGCVAYELLTGRPPFSGELPAAIMHQHETAAPRPPGELRSGIPAALDALVLQMLAKDPRSRPQSAQALADAFPVSLDGPSAAPPNAGREASQTAATRALRRPTRRFSRGKLVALGVAVAISAAGLVLALTSGSSAPRPSRAAAAGATGATLADRRGTTAASSKRARTTPAKSPAQPVKTQSAPSVGPRTVAGVAGALTSLVTADYERGGLDQPAAEQILAGLHDAVDAYDKADAKGALHHVGDLAVHVEKLAAHGDIQPSALGAITAAVSGLQAAIERAVPPAAGGLGTGSPPGPKAAGVAPSAKKPKGPKSPKGPRHHPD